MNNHQKEQQLEEQHLAQCLKIIQQNIHLYEDKEKPVQKEPFCTSRRTSFCTKKNLETQGFFKLRMMGLEPIRSHLRKILSLVRLPFRHIRLYSGTFSAPEQKIYYHRFLDLASLFNFYQFFSNVKTIKCCKVICWSFRTTNHLYTSIFFQQ